MQKNSDKELLKLAAKAAGMLWIDDREHGLTIQRNEGGMPYNFHWNPLGDDGDALRLAYALADRVTVYIPITPDGCALVLADRRATSIEGTSRPETTRRAIVTAAAEIGRGMP